MIQNNAKEIAKKFGFSCVEYVENWKGNKVYVPYNPPKRGATPPIEKPLVIDAVKNIQEAKMEFDANLITVEEVHALTDEELSDAIDAKYG